MSTPPTEKYCRGCGKRLPLDHFRRIHKGKDWPRHSECRECRNRHDRKRRKRARERRISNVFKKLSKEDKPGRLNAIIESLIVSSGGHDKFFREFEEFYHGNSLTPAGRSRFLGKIMDLTIHQGELKMEAEAAERAAWEKAHAEMPERFDRMAMDEMLRTFAPVYRHYGWPVKPPRKQP